VADKKAQVGIAVIVDGRDTLTVNNDVRYPMMSVFKFPPGFGCGRRLRTARRFFRYVGAYPAGRFAPGYVQSVTGQISGRKPVSFRGRAFEVHFAPERQQCLRHLFRVFGGPAATDEYLRGMGLRDFAIEATEDDMHRNLADCYRNWTTPLEAVRLLEWLVSGKAAKGAYRDFIEQTMISCQTGRDRLPAPLASTKAVIGHKTGTGDRNGKGQIIGTNDIGFVFLPDGRRYSIAVLVRDSEESEQATARIIADISEAVYRYVSGER